jgi:hypothetical protein
MSNRKRNGANKGPHPGQIQNYQCLSQVLSSSSGMTQFTHFWVNKAATHAESRFECLKKPQAWTSTVASFWGKRYAINAHISLLVPVTPSYGRRIPDLQRTRWILRSSAVSSRMPRDVGWGVKRTPRGRKEYLLHRFGIKLCA